MKITHKNAPFDHHMTEPDVDRMNNIIIGIAVGIMIAICAVIYLVASLIS